MAGGEWLIKRVIDLSKDPPEVVKLSGLFIYILNRVSVTVTCYINGNTAMEIPLNNIRKVKVPYNFLVIKWSSKVNETLTLLLGTKDIDVFPFEELTKNMVLVDSSGVELSSYVKNVDVGLSTRASESTLSAISGNIDVALSSRASEATLSSVDGKLRSPSSGVKGGTVSVGTSAAQLDAADSVVRRAIILKADPNNTADVLIGDSSSQWYPLSAGQTLVLYSVAPSEVYVRTTSTAAQSLHWITGGW